MREYKEANKNKMANKKQYQVVYKFSDVIQTIEAESEEEAQRIADDALMGDYNPQNDTTCYEVEVEELE